MTELHEPDTTEVEDVPLAPDEQEAAEAEEAEDAQATEQGEPGEPQDYETARLERGVRDDLDYEAAKKELDKAKKSLAGEDKRHLARIREIMGEDAAQLHPCALCTPTDPDGVKLAGYRFNVMPDAEQLARVKAAIGEPIQPDYERDRYSNVCDACKGYGRTRTGSKVAGQGDVTCLPCSGRGWVPVGAERSAGAITVANGATANALPNATPVDLSEPPEATALKALNWIVVPPPPVAP